MQNMRFYEICPVDEVSNDPCVFGYYRTSGIVLSANGGYAVRYRTDAAYTLGNVLCVAGRSADEDLLESAKQTAHALDVNNLLNAAYTINLDINL
jgi:hypothetical protein